MSQSGIQKALSKDSALNILTWCIVAAGITLRLVLYFQNRNLIIDEANIVRNLAERGFGGLVLPLKYEQFAPPVFLWFEKLSSVLLGYGEQAMRLYPLLCGVAALVLFRKLLLQFMPLRSAWFPLTILAVTYLPVKYSVEMKQYMPDTMIALALTLLATRLDIFREKPRRFLLTWLVAGIVAIWSSMPSVFILAGIGIYYFLRLLYSRQWHLLRPLIVVGAGWGLMFVVYYFAILKPQIESDYLQNYHKDYFLFATPSNFAEWQHNWARMKELICNVGGYEGRLIFINVSLILLGSVQLFIHHRQKALLAVLPIVITLIAAALKQFSLIDRVCLFLLPFIMILLGYGLEGLLQHSLRTYRWAAVALGTFILVQNNNMFWLLHTRLGFHEITEGLSYLKSKQVSGQRIYVHDASVPTYLYYTQLHPNRQQWTSLLGAHLMKWDSDYTTETNGLKEPVYFLYTGGFPEPEKIKRTGQIEVNMQQVDYFEKYICYVYGYAPKGKP